MLNMQKFNHFEKQLNLLEQQVRGFHYWGYLRFDIYRIITKAEDGIKNDGSVERYKFGNIFKFIVRSIFLNPTHKVKGKDVLFLANSKRVYNGLNYECIFTDEIAKEFRKNSYSAGLPTSESLEQMLPNESDNFLFLDYIIFWGQIWKIFHKEKYSKESKEFNQIAKKLSLEIKENFSIEIEEDYIYKKMMNTYMDYVIRREMVRRLLEKINPKVIVEMDGYSHSRMVFNEIAKELNIVTIELQHGILGKGHPAYNYPKKKQYDFVPDKIFLFSKYWKDACDFPQYEENIIVTGFPYMDRSKKKYLDIKKEENDLSIIVISQPIFSEKLLPHIVKLIELFEESEVNYNLIYKLHPKESLDEESESWIKLKRNKRVEIVNNSQKHVHFYLSKCDIQIGMHSTVIFEGLTFGLRTFIYRMPSTVKMMTDIVDKGYARMFNDASSLFQMIMKEEVEKKCCEDFFIDGGKERIVEEIKKILR